MDKLSIFGSKDTSEITLKEGSLDTVVENLGDINRELKLTRIGHEEFDWEKEVEEVVNTEDLEEE